MVTLQDPVNPIPLLLARMESRHVHGVGADPRGDIYAGLTQDRRVDEFAGKG